MSVKAVCVLHWVNVDSTNAGRFKANVSVVGLESGNPAEFDTQFDNLDPEGFLAAQLQDLVQAYLVANYSYSFSTSDKVRVVGSSI
jgi:hypothetical protein